MYKTYLYPRNTNLRQNMKMPVTVSLFEIEMYFLRLTIFLTLRNPLALLPAFSGEDLPDLIQLITKTRQFTILPTLS